MKRSVFFAVAAMVAVCTGSAWAQAPAPQRMQELTRMVRQDCGSCHGMRLTGGWARRSPLRPWSTSCRRICNTSSCMAFPARRCRRGVPCSLLPKPNGLPSNSGKAFPKKTGAPDKCTHYNVAPYFP